MVNCDQNGINKIDFRSMRWDAVAASENARKKKTEIKQKSMRATETEQTQK